MRSHRWLIGLVLLSATLYAGLAALYPLSRGLLFPRKMWAQQVGASPAIGLVHAAIYTSLFVVYVVALRRAVRIGGEASAERSAKASRPVTISLVVFGWLLGSISLLFSFPGESADIFDYTFRGRMMTEYGLSPLATTPHEIKNMPFHRYLSWSQWVDAYGPAWEYASAGVSWIVKRLASPDELLVVINQTCANQPAVCTLLTKYVTGYRLLAISLTGVCGVLVSSIVFRLSSGLALAALLAWLWNPLVIVSTALGAHNDVLMLVPILVAVLLFQREQWLLGLIALLIAAHIKITALVMLPVLCMWLVVRCGWRRAMLLTIVAFAIVLPISWLLYAPLGGWAALPRNLFERSLLSTNSPGELLYLLLRDGFSLSRFRAQQFVARAAPLAFALAAFALLWHYFRQWRPRRESLRDEDLWRACLAIVFAYLVIGSFWFQSWYLVWLIALAALLPVSRLTQIVMPVFAVSAMIAGVASDYLRHQPAPPLSSGQISLLTVVITLLPMACVAVWMALNHRRHRRQIEVVRQSAVAR